MTILLGMFFAEQITTGVCERLRKKIIVASAGVCTNGCDRASTHIALDTTGDHTNVTVAAPQRQDNLS